MFKGLSLCFIVFVGLLISLTLFAVEQNKNPSHQFSSCSSKLTGAVKYRVHDMRKGLVSDAEYEMYKSFDVKRLLEIKASKAVKSSFPIGDRKPRIVGVGGGPYSEEFSHVSAVQVIKFRNDSAVEMLFHQFNPDFMVTDYMVDYSALASDKRKYTLKPGEEASFPVVIVTSQFDSGNSTDYDHSVVAVFQGNNTFAMDANESITFAVKPKGDEQRPFPHIISLNVVSGLDGSPWDQPVTEPQEHLFRFVDDRELYDERSKLNGQGHIQTYTQMTPPSFDEKAGRPLSMYELRNTGYYSYLAPEPAMSRYRQEWLEEWEEEKALEAEDVVKEAAKSKATKH